MVYLSQKRLLSVYGISKSGAAQTIPKQYRKDTQRI